LEAAPETLRVVLWLPWWWPLSDEAGNRFQASVFVQPFPEYSSGWCLSLKALGAGIELDHADVLQVSDTMGQR
jgi:hypothetical protein